ncbi:ATP-binding protein [Sphingobium rhizovicinum]|uniref:histidine kinase n=1 Tax=Sphingobium rhizovicinum TaxID=432308 RepID=A0ABV7N811_9SPHN
MTIISGPGAIIRVRDQGAGLSEEKLAQLIRRHQRADHASPHGAGLGLSITHRIMSAHNGHIRTSETLRELILDFRLQ